MGSKARRSEPGSSDHQPVRTVVGFHVEGVPHSQEERGLLAADQMAASPSPVIIPTSFQKSESPVRSGLHRQNTFPLNPGHAAGNDSAESLDNLSDKSASQSMGGAAQSLPQFVGANSEGLRQAIQQPSLSSSLDAAPSGGPGRSQQSAEHPERHPGASQPTEDTEASAFQRADEAAARAPVFSPPHSTPPLAATDPTDPTGPTGPGVAEPRQKPSLERTSTSAAAAAASGSTTPQGGSRVNSPGNPSPPPAGVSKPQKKAPDSSSRRQSEAGTAKKGQQEPQPGGKGKAGQEAPKATTKAERRAVQERQRAEKKAAKEEGESKPAAADKGGRADARPSQQPPVGSPPAGPEAAGKGGPRGSKSGQKGRRQEANAKSADMFSHLPPYRAVTLDSLMAEGGYEAVHKVHSAILKLGLQLTEGSVSGASARSLAMLQAFHRLIQDYQTPGGKVLSRDLTSQLNMAIQFLVHCRPLSVPQGNAIKFLKLQVSKVDPTTPQEEAKKALLAKLDTYVDEKILFAGSMVVANAASKIEDGDIVLTYAHSSVILRILQAAREAGKEFRVIVVDGRPHMEGKKLLQQLLRSGISASYCLLNALTYVIKEATKVLLGAAAVMSNGTVVSRVGSAAIAMAAHAWGRPVIICCETHKFAERVQLDSITANELGDPEALLRPLVPSAKAIGPDAMAGWLDVPQLGLLNVVYDAMPSEYVAVIVTEFGAIPPTSVPVILREYRQEPPM